MEEKALLPSYWGLEKRISRRKEVLKEGYFITAHYILQNGGPISPCFPCFRSELICHIRETVFYTIRTTRISDKEIAFCVLVISFFQKLQQRKDTSRLSY